jgi:ribosomal protein S18 acetylase RimI-like enzyme
VYIDPEKVTIRRAATDDADILARIGRLTFAQSYADIIPPEDLESYTAGAFSPDLITCELSDPRTIYLLACIETNVCGYAKLQPTTTTPQISVPGPVELMRLYVVPGYEGNGIGSKLIKAALEATAGADYHSCWLRVWAGNKEAIRFYHRWRFEEVGSEPYMVGQASETVLLMVRDLQDLMR